MRDFFLPSLLEKSVFFCRKFQILRLSSLVTRTYICIRALKEIVNLRFYDQLSETVSLCVKK
jgi:hypothetical protein